MGSVPGGSVMVTRLIGNRSPVTLIHSPVRDSFDDFYIYGSCGGVVRRIGLFSSSYG